MYPLAKPFVLTVGLLALAACDAGNTAKPSATEAQGFSFDGHWSVAGVAVSDDGVQALVDNDPSLMNRTLTFSPELLKWDAQDGPDDACKDPSINALSSTPAANKLALLDKLGMSDTTAYSVRCETGSWGPVKGAGQIFYTTAAGDVALVWYDGALLKLKPVR
ncbi:hypothetical protein ACE1YR_22165 [Pseudomonas sp. K1(2024)]|uniref:Lipoprotein n=1 Tax=Pseudomonas boreofloridensis TaxID=3064348 RepID=A0ABV4ZGZ0_9PSED|nr:hypothetical protein [Pseudomonas sp. K13]MDO7904667.1 hypothetical protein [Pseudomonas sp. K13]